MGVSPWDDVSRTFIIRYDVDHWNQDQIYRVFDMFSVQSISGFFLSLAYNIGTCVTTIIESVVYIHDPDSTMTFDPKVQFKGFMTWLCVRATDFFPLT